IWSAMRNTGSIVGGSINFYTNYKRSSAGGIAWSTYLIFVGFECTGVIWALMLSPTSKVRHRDGSKAATSTTISWGAEFQALWKHLQNRKTWLMFFPAFYSFFYGGTLGTYLALHFSVRARALSSLITPTITIPMVVAYGRLMDQQRWSQMHRAWMGFLIWFIPQVGCFIWIGIEYSKFGTEKAALDYLLTTITDVTTTTVTPDDGQKPTSPTSSSSAPATSPNSPSTGSSAPSPQTSSPPPAQGVYSAPPRH
ncbi:hypothetical protein V490_09115, partial [Pseudogymnoascus sp. VKM F-3557]